MGASYSLNKRRLIRGSNDIVFVDETVLAKIQKAYS